MKGALSVHTVWIEISSAKDLEEGGWATPPDPPKPKADEPKKRVTRSSASEGRKGKDKGKKGKVRGGVV